MLEVWIILFNAFADALGMSQFELGFLLILLLLCGIIRGLYIWQPKWKSKKTKDEDGNEEIKHYYLDD